MDFKFTTFHGTTHGVGIKLQLGESELKFWSEGQIHPIAATALEFAIDREIARRMEEIRRHAYNAGWSDAKKKNQKKTEFYSCLNGPVSVVGW